MVFSWLRQFFQKPAAAAIRLKLAGVPMWVQGRRSSLFEEKLRPKVEGSATSILRNFRDFKQMSLDMSKAELDSFDTSVTVLLETSRTAFCRQLDITLENIDGWAEFDYAKSLQFQAWASRTLNRVGEAANRHNRLLAMAFRDRLIDLRNKLSESKNQLSSLTQTLAEYQSDFEALERLEHLGSKLASLRKEVEESQKEEIELETKKEEAKGKLLELQSSLGDLKASSEFSRVTELQSTIRRIEEELDDHTASLVSVLSPLISPLKKLHHDSGGIFTKEEAALLTLYIDQPATALAADVSLLLKSRFLAELTKLPIDSLVPKESEREKVKTLLSRFGGTAELSDWIKSRQALEAEKAATTEALSEFSSLLSDLEVLEGLFQRTNQEVIELTTAVAANTRRREALNNESQAMKTEIEHQFKLLGEPLVTLEI